MTGDGTCGNSMSELGKNMIGANGIPSLWKSDLMLITVKEVGEARTALRPSYRQQMITPTSSASN